MKISVIFAARDPDYGGNLLHHFQVFVNGFVTLADRYGLDYELLFVEWNPPPDKDKIFELIKWPTTARQKSIRIIEVPSAIHNRFPNSGCMPIFEYIAKNVGIRRAKGKWILATNPDLLFNEELIRFLAYGQLSPDCFYRIDRYDVGATVPLDIPFEEQLKFCSQHVVKINKFYASIEVKRDGSALRLLGELIRRYRLLWAYWRQTQLKNPVDGQVIGPRDGLHRNAAGDFFLMHRDLWDNLRGYPELTTHSHIDAIMCWIAASYGLRQVILRQPMRLYHQEHDRSIHRMLPKTDWRPWYHRFLECIKSQQPMVVNDEAWGLANEDLKEWTIFADLPSGA